MNIAEVLPKDTRRPLFIADPEGLFYVEFAKAVSSDFLPVVLTREKRQDISLKEGVLIAYRKSLPRIPNNSFAAFYLIEGEEVVQKDLLVSLLKEAEVKNVSLNYILPFVRSHDKDIKSLRRHEKVHFFFYFEIFDSSRSEGAARSIVDKARRDGKVVLENQGLNKVNPITGGFLLDAVIRYSLLENPSSREIVLLPEGEAYELTFFRMLQRLDPLLRLDFKKNKQRKKVTSQRLEGALYLYEPRAKLDEKIRELLSQRNIIEKVSTKKTKKERKGTHRFFIFVFVVIAVMAVYLVAFLGASYYGKHFLLKSIHLASNLSFAEAEQAAKESNGAFSLSETLSSVASPYLVKTALEKPLASLVSDVQIGQRVSGSLESVMEYLKNYQHREVGGRSLDKEEFSQTIQQIKNLLLFLSELRGEKLLKEPYAGELARFRVLTNLFLSSQEVLPELAGYTGEKKYLLLFQNNNELRPTGGFIGSYAVLQVKDGKVADFKVKDVYDADGQLKGHVEPPAALKKYLGVAHWYLRDSNFSPDFPTSAGNAAYFLNLETGEKVDGVIAVDTSILKGLLHITGPLKIDGITREVTEKNIVDIVQEKSQNDFFPGSTQKKDTLSLVSEAILQKLVTGKSGAKAAGLLDVVETAIEQKHLLIAFADETLEKPFLLENASSSLTSAQETEDLIGINEANIGENKVNAHIVRSFAYKLALAADGERSMTVSETLENKSKIGDSFSGEYKAYVRILLPKDVSPETISIDGTEQVVLSPLQNQAAYVKRGAVAANTIEVERIDEKNRSTYGFYITVPQGQKRTIAFSYNREDTTSQSGLGSYGVELFKQPGTGPDPFSFSIELPKGFTLLSSSVPFIHERDRYTRLSLLSSDQIIRISYGEK